MPKHHIKSWHQKRRREWAPLQNKLPKALDCRHTPHRSIADEPVPRTAGSAAAADVLARQREQPTGGYGTPKGAARLARHVPGRARNEPPRADAVTGQTSDCRCTTKARATARLLRGLFQFTGDSRTPPPSAGGVTERFIGS
jgi:hypothetical protein